MSEIRQKAREAGREEYDDNKIRHIQPQGLPPHEEWLWKHHTHIYIIIFA